MIASYDVISTTWIDPEDIINSTSEVATNLANANFSVKNIRLEKNGEIIMTLIFIICYTIVVHHKHYLGSSLRSDSAKSLKVVALVALTHSAHQEL